MNGIKPLSPTTIHYYTLAIADLTKAIQLKPDFVIAYIERGDTFFELGNYDAAISDYDAALRLDPNSDRARSMREKALVYRNPIVTVGIEKIADDPDGDNA